MVMKDRRHALPISRRFVREEDKDKWTEDAGEGGGVRATTFFLELRLPGMSNRRLEKECDTQRLIRNSSETKVELRGAQPLSLFVILGVAHRTARSVSEAHTTSAQLSWKRCRAQNEYTVFSEYTYQPRRPRSKYSGPRRRSEISHCTRSLAYTPFFSATTTRPTD